MAAKMVSPIGDTIASIHRTTDSGYIFRRIFFLFLFFFRASFLFFTLSTSRTVLPQQLDFLHAARDSLPHLTTRRLIAHVARLFP
jgi:uncharacterized BrkB/YihY/UPF0761 family membrane protein